MEKKKENWAWQDGEKERNPYDGMQWACVSAAMMKILRKDQLNEVVGR